MKDMDDVELERQESNAQLSSSSSGRIRKSRAAESSYSFPQHYPITYETIYLKLPRYQIFRHTLNNHLSTLTQQLFFSLRILQGKELLVDLLAKRVSMDSLSSHTSCTTSTTTSSLAASQQFSNGQVSGDRSSLVRCNSSLWEKGIPLNDEDISQMSISMEDDVLDPFAAEPDLDSSQQFTPDDLELSQKAIHAVYKDWKLLIEGSPHTNLLKRSIFDMIQLTQKSADRVQWNDICISHQYDNVDDEKCNFESLVAEEKHAIGDLRRCKNITVPLELYWSSDENHSTLNAGPKTQALYEQVGRQLQNFSISSSDEESGVSIKTKFATLECLRTVELSTLCLWLGWIYVMDDEKDQGLCWLDTSVRIIENTIQSLDGQHYMFEYYSRARLWKNDDLIIREYTKAIQQRPRCPLPYNNLAISYTKCSKPMDALRCYNASIKLDPKYTLSYNNRASLWANAFTSFDHAEEDYKTAIEIGDELILSYMNRANFFRTFRKDSIRSILDYTRCLALEPEDADSLYCDRADTYLHIGYTAKALEDYNSCLGLNPTHMVALYNRGMLFAGSLNRPQNAIADYTKCIECAIAQDASLRTISGALNNRGIIFQELGDFARAYSDFEKALKIFNQSSHARSNLENLRIQINARWARGNQ